MEADEMKSVDIFPRNTADSQEGVDIFPRNTADNQEGVDLFLDNTAGKQMENLLSPKDLLLSMEDDLARLHQILSTGIGACWEGDAYSSHRMLEDALFQRAEEALSRIRALIQMGQSIVHAKHQ